MNRKVFTLLFFAFFLTKAQTGIGTATPHASAKLEVSATNQGFLPPRVALTATNAATPVSGPANGLMVFNTATAGTGAFQVVPGYYYWDTTGAKWVSISTSVASVQNQGVFRSTSNTSAGAAVSSWNTRFNNIASADLTITSNTTFALSNGIYKLEWALPFQQANTYNVMQLQENKSGTWGLFLNDNGFAAVGNGGGTDWGGGTYATDVIDCTAGTRTFRLINADGSARVLYYGAAFTITKLNPAVGQGSTTGDNLGNHTATQNILLSGNYLSNDGTSEGIRIDNSGNVGINTATPTQALEVNGNVKATNFMGTASSALSAPTNITYAEIDVPQNVSVGPGFVDLASIPLPSAGKYKITYVVRASISTSATLAVLTLRNGANAQVIGTEAMAIYNSANMQVTCTQVSVVTTTAAETYKLSAWVQAGAGTMQVINDGNGRSKVLWEKIQ